MQSDNEQLERLEFDNSVFLPALIELMHEDNGHLFTIIARGNSMRPFIEDSRDKLVFGKAKNCKVGDVILAEVHPGHFVCHRIESIKGNIVVMRGDGNVFGTETFPTSAIKAKLLYIERKGKTYSTDHSKIWKIYSAIWPKLFPLRRYLLAFYRLVWLHQLPERFKR